MDFDVSKVVTQYSDDKIKYIGSFGYYADNLGMLKQLVANNYTWINYAEVVGVENDGRFKMRYVKKLNVQIAYANYFYPVSLPVEEDKWTALKKFFKGM